MSSGEPRNLIIDQTNGFTSSMQHGKQLLDLIFQHYVQENYCTQDISHCANSYSWVFWERQ